MRLAELKYLHGDLREVTSIEDDDEQDEILSSNFRFNVRVPTWHDEDGSFAFERPRELYSGAFDWAPCFFPDHYRLSDEDLEVLNTNTWRRLDEVLKVKAHAPEDGKSRARSVPEMLFALSLIPCPRCGAREPAESLKDARFRSGRHVFFWTFPCSGCGEERHYSFESKTDWPVGRELGPHDLGGAEPSEIISPSELIAELQRLLAELPDAPESLDHVAWRRVEVLRNRAATCVTELFKFIPQGAEAIPEAALGAPGGSGPEPLAQRRALQDVQRRLTALDRRLAADAPRIWALEEEAYGPRLPRKGKLNEDTIEAHRLWVRRGFTGEGRLELANFKVEGVRFPVTFQKVRFEGMTFERCTFWLTRFDGAELTDVSFAHDNLEGASFSDATIRGGTMARANLPLVRFNGAEVEGTDLSRSGFTRSQWQGAVVKKASFRLAGFGDTTFDGGSFIECDMRGASFATVPVPEDRPDMSYARLCTSRGARFEGCDLRDTVWTGRDLSGATFVRCRFAGASGAPRAAEDVVLEDCDVPDLEALLRQLA